MLMAFVKKSLIYATHGLMMENVRPAIKGMLLKTDNVLEIQMHLMDLTIHYALTGVGTIENA